MNPRHPWSAQMCALLSTMLDGRAADKAQVPQDGGSLVRLPHWTWHVPGIEMGHKGHDEQGRAWAFPIRVSWSQPTVMVVPDGAELTAYWEANGMGLALSGEMVVRGTGPMDDVLVDDPYGAPRWPAGPSLSPAKAMSALSALATEGEHARWSARLGFERDTHQAVTRAVRLLSLDKAADQDAPLVPQVLDHIGIDEVTSTMLLGDGAQVGAVDRLIDRMLAPAAFAKVDPQRYARFDLAVRAVEAVQVKIGDPRIGRKVRRVWRELPPGSSTDDLIAAYRVQYPADRLSTERATRALAPAGDAMANAVRIPGLTSGGGDL